MLANSFASQCRTGMLTGLAILALLGAGRTAQAEPVQHRAPDGTPLNAEYHKGDTGRPAILVVHGFLQTYEFITTQSVIDGLSSLGYTVLGPNMSLGVPDRKQSMQCRAPHRNTFDQDLSEIGLWVEWLRRAGHASVILVGHSWGSQHALGYADAYPRAPVAAVIAISLVRAEQGATLRNKQIAAAEARQARRDRSLQPYVLSYCKPYMATPESYLSYARWGDAQVIDALARLQQRAFPIEVVIGSEDRRIDDAWIQSLRRHATQVTVVEGANHFFSSMHELDLNDRIEEILARINTPPRPE